MRFTQRNAAVAALLGAVIVWLLGLWTMGSGQPVLWHAMLFALGGAVGVADLFVLSLLSRRKG